ncbi:hypothetical protein BY458DRAFT_550614 [Sporodiniella umbellata]|nr:hypothetical protein BY458DRAFT_550614 [Sporodiniella umbellata]
MFKFRARVYEPKYFPTFKSYKMVNDTNYSRSHIIQIIYVLVYLELSICDYLFYLYTRSQAKSKKCDRNYESTMQSILYSIVKAFVPLYSQPFLIQVKMTYHMEQLQGKM